MEEIYNLETVCRRCAENDSSACELYYLRKMKVNLRLVDDEDVHLNESLRKRVEHYNAENLPQKSFQELPDEFAFETIANPVAAGRAYHAERVGAQYKITFPRIGFITYFSERKMKDNILKKKFIIVEEEDK